jgi:hypothetical protein
VSRVDPPSTEFDDFTRYMIDHNQEIQFAPCLRKLTTNTSIEHESLRLPEVLRLLGVTLELSEKDNPHMTQLRNLIVLQYFITSRYLCFIAKAIAKLSPSVHDINKCVTIEIPSSTQASDRRGRHGRPRR